MNILIDIIIVFLFVFMNGFFVVVEFVVVKVWKFRIEILVIEGNINVKYILKVVNDLNLYLLGC